MTDMCTLDADLAAPDGAVRWHVGHNDWGYSPDNPPSCHDTVNDAREALASDIGTLVEYLADGCAHAKHVKSCENCRNYAVAFAAQNHLANGDASELGDGVRFELNDGRTLPVVYWAWPVPYDALDGRHDHMECNE